MRIPVSTYRLQIRESFDLFAAANIADYVHELGADWLYLSPLLKAEPGSDHGYDVVDHTQIDPTRGGADGLDAAAAAARRLGLGVLIDIVPNHVGVASPAQNAWWWDLITHGRDSRYAEAFDVDWEFGGGKVRIPVLGDGPSTSSGTDALDDLEIVGGELHYFDNRYPLAPGTADDGASAREVHARQNYELINWRRADAELNYRRFFAVNTLAGIRVEVPWVFAESHAEILRWITEGLADGLRVDHPDGLADPGGYLDALAAETGGSYVLVEKILEGDEQLPTNWATEGTTGYDALADVDRVLVDPAGRTALDELDRRLRDTDVRVSWTDLIHKTKRSIADGILRSEVLRLERDLGESVEHTVADEGWKLSPTADALAELLACFPVYRSYLPLGAEHLREAAHLAKRHRPELSDTVDEIVAVLADPGHPASVRFQQTSGMVMAKGVEDTAFYRYTRLGSLTEVGADPSEFSIGVAEFHRRQQLRQASFPASLTTLSTHDTKRGEDVRARISVLAEMPERWESALGELRGESPLGDGPLEVLLWEAIVGAWPASRERLHAYAEKAAREAGNSTRWTAPKEDFERRMHELVDSVFDDERVAGIIRGLLDVVEQPGWSNSLSAKLIQLTAPGVPDVYQGSELWETSLVDPDNRRPVDFDIRRLYLAAIDAGSHPGIDETGAAKLLVTSRALRLRRDRPDLFTRYAPITAFGAGRRHVIGFDRGGAVTLATRLPLGLSLDGGWRDTSVQLPGRPVLDLITGKRYEGGTLQMADALGKYPVALLIPDDGIEEDRS
ncbi:malto-oligosyltrehalose synthase [Lacisediminihabitans changchengi]|uniref:Malto-oligosyltrehalose synthase n=1 Tax=Lacisediminihabitans changchengi TaxID=2787634 RepID=A0A934SQ11_9MICO|nr:malto-oligosyltrehalose synthase [Lacisediminihabitans changchengi]MBK4346079.1 malto-oligosyltrehalose synthase [Lacisediminihabitans changchengi]